MKYLEEKEGSIFFIPLFLPDIIKDGIKSYYRYKFDEKERYAYGRLIKIDKGGGDIIEIFNYVGSIPLNEDVILRSGLMFSPIHATLGFEKKRWRFIFENQKYDKYRDSNYNGIGFLMGIEKPRLVLGDQEVGFASKEELEKYEDWIVYDPVAVENKIRKHIETSKY